MDKKFIESVQKKMTEERDVILQSLSAQTNAMKNLVSSGESGDVVDIASNAVDRALLDSLNAQDSARLKQINAALDRIREGRYGVCVACGKDIPSARLKALPYAVMCVNCTEAQEKRRH